MLRSWSLQKNSSSGRRLMRILPSPGRDAARRALDLPEKAKVLLFFGQIKKVKGLDTLIAAMPAILERHPEAMLMIAGRPWKDDFEDYDRQIDALKIHDACRTDVRFIHDDELPVYFGAADVVILPYRRIYQSGVLLLALSYAVPVLVSDIDGMRESIKDGDNGFTFRVDDADSLSTKACAILDDMDAAVRTAERGRDRIRDDNDWRMIGRKLKVTYEEALVATT